MHETKKNYVVESFILQVVTYEQLGIINQKPVRPDLAVAATRISTFTAGEWPHMRTHPPELMAEAGFYYTGETS